MSVTGTSEVLLLVVGVAVGIGVLGWAAREWLVLQVRIKSFLGTVLLTGVIVLVLYGAAQR